MSANEEDEEEASCHVETFRAQISRFSMVVPSLGPATTPRKIPQKTSSRTNNHALTRLASDTLPNSSISPEKLALPCKRLAIDRTEGSPSPGKKAKRGYAAPETYAHLKPLGDYLKENLDGQSIVIDCDVSLFLCSHFLWYKVSISSMPQPI